MFVNLSILANSRFNARRRSRRPRAGPRTRVVERLEDRIALSIEADAFESNDSLETASVLGAGMGVQLHNLTLHTSDDQDWFAFHLVCGDQVRVTAESQLGIAVDAAIFDSAGNLLASVEADNPAASTAWLDSGRYYERIASAALETDVYMLRILPGPESTTRLYYFNDASVANNVYSTAPGNNANTGLNPWNPKTTVSNVLSTYGVNPGDVILIDTGEYNDSPTVFADDEGAV